MKLKQLTTLIVAAAMMLLASFNGHAQKRYYRAGLQQPQVSVKRPATLVLKKRPDLGMYGFLKIGQFKKQVKWGDTITLTPADAFLVSNGKPAFNVYYSHREYAGAPASGFKNKIFFNGKVVSIQSKLKLKPKQIKPIHTQAYLGPKSGKLEIRIDADNDIKESNENNNFNFFVYIRFKGFGNGTSLKHGFQGHAYERKSDGSIGPKLGGVKIRFKSEHGGFVKLVQTNRSGFYKIALKKGRYYVSASRPGYLPYSSAPGFFVVTGNGFQTGNIFLKKKQLHKKPDVGMYGFLKLGKYKKLVKWGQTIVLTPADATLISNGKPAFEVYYAHREYAGAATGIYKNKVYFNGKVVSIQSNRKLKPKEIEKIHTQAYLGPQNGVLEIRIDADNDVAESNESNNFNFKVKVLFKGF